MTSNEGPGSFTRPSVGLFGIILFIPLYAGTAMALSHTPVSLGRATVVSCIVCASDSSMAGLVSS